MYQPLNQFEIYYFGNYDDFYTYKLFGIELYSHEVSIAITNALIYFFIVYIIIKIIFSLPIKKPYICPNSWIYVINKLYEFVFDLVKQQLDRRGISFFPIIFTLFLFLLITNLLGMTLYSFTLTSHISIAFTLSFSFFLGIILLGIIIQKQDFVHTFIPKGAPIFLLPFIVIIEIISYLTRPFSLGIRLFANMMAGHTLLAILANFIFLISQKNIFWFFIPFFLFIVIVGFEVMIAILQAYVFTILICIYIKDSIFGAH